MVFPKVYNFKKVLHINSPKKYSSPISKLPTNDKLNAEDQIRQNKRPLEKLGNELPQKTYKFQKS